MSIRSKILEPSIALICVGLFTLAWISLSSLQANRNVLARYDTVYAESELLEAILLELEALQSFSDGILEFNKVVPPEQVQRVFQTHVDTTAAHIVALEYRTQDANLSHLRQAVSRWSNALATALGVNPGSAIPSRHHLAALASEVRTEVAQLHDSVLQAASTFGSNARARLLSQLIAAAAFMLSVLIGVGLFVLRRGIWLADAMKSLAHSMERIRTGNFDAMPDHMERADELGEIARGVAAFSQSLEKLTEAKTRIEHMAMNDTLTGLANRAKLASFISWLLDPETDPGATFTVLHLDLDRFKDVNDTYGHAAGDAVLCRVGEILNHNIRPIDLAARIGGDEFVIVLRKTSEMRAVEPLAQRIIEAVSQPFDFEGERLRVGASIGVALSSSARTQDRLLANADVALYLAKGAGRGQYCVFSEETGSEYANRKRMLKEMKAALHNGQIRPFFQPQIDGVNNDIIGAEALVRWDHPDRGILTPGQFLDLANENGLGEVLTEVMINASIKALQSWRKAGLHLPTVSLNFTARQLRSADVMATLRSRVHAAGLSPSDIAIEVLETVLFGDENDEAFANLMAMQELGFRVELDDFGTGHASISTLSKIKVDRVKIDRSFVADATVNPDQERLLSALIDLCNNLGIECLTEGVETEADRGLLISLGCRYFQGYAFARPMEAAETLEWLKNWYKGSSSSSQTKRPAEN